MIEKDMLRFCTVGSVDDGKSTLIGRLLYDTNSLCDDQVEMLQKVSKKRGQDFIDFSLLTDGLKAEREQGITIDVAYRYFSTEKRKFIIADCPGHVQYTRNMITGSSSSQLVLLLVDARKGVLEQTRRHLFLSSLLGIKHLVICINKMDMVNYDERVFHNAINEVKQFLVRMDIHDVHFIPLSALKGENIVKKSENFSWYEGPTLLYLLENIHVMADGNFIDGRFPVQMVIRPMREEFHDFRGLAGRVESGVFRPGDEVMVLPLGLETKVKSITTMDGEQTEAFYPQSVCLTLDDEYDVSRGDMVVKKNNRPEVSQDLDVMLCFMGNQELDTKKRYLVKQTTREVKAYIREVIYKIDINTLRKVNEGALRIVANDIARVKMRLSAPLFFDDFKKNRNTGVVILMDEVSNETIATGIIDHRELSS